MSNLKTIISSFKLQDELNPKIWISSKTSEKEKLRSDIRERLLEISQYFIESFDIDVVIDDIIITGSLVNYNWSQFSDVDLHIVIDFTQFPEKYRQTFKDFLNLKKMIFNLKHEIKVKDFDVELYAQDSDEAHFSLGTYSVMNDEWIKYPKKEKVEIDTTAVKNKSKHWMEMIDSIIEESKEVELEEGLKLLKKVKDKIKTFRTSGLQKGGEYSVENLVFKVLRRNGYLEKLFEFQDSLMDKKLSLNEGNTIVQGNLKTDLENGPKNHGARAFGNWQSDNAWDMFAPAGTIVKSFTNGQVSNIRNTGKNSGKVFGTQVSIKGTDGYPDIFYTHLKDVKLNVGDKVSVGDDIGPISEWVGHDNMTHVHVGLPYGLKLSDLIKGDMQGMKIKPDTDKENVDDLIDKLEDIELPIEPKDGSYDKNIELIQKGLTTLGYELPIFHVDGILGVETKAAIDKFIKDNDLDENKGSFKDKFKNIFSEGILKEEKMISPLPQLNITSPYGQPRGNITHPGVDLGIASGTQIKSPADGVVIDAETRNNACGGTLFIDHQNGLKTRYCHLKDIRVKKGDKVSTGDIVGLTGGGQNDIGRGNSQGPHLHFEMYQDGKLVNPMDFIDKDIDNSDYKKDSDEKTESIISKDFIEKLIEKLEDLE